VISTTSRAAPTDWDDTLQAKASPATIDTRCGQLRLASGTALAPASFPSLRLVWICLTSCVNVGGVPAGGRVLVVVAGAVVVDDDDEVVVSGGFGFVVVVAATVVDGVGVVGVVDVVDVVVATVDVDVATAVVGGTVVVDDRSV
jgi:hypothetical protein